MKVLALESEHYYNNLFNFKKYSLTVDFDGLNKYNCKDEELRSYDIIMNFTFNSALADFIILRAKKMNITTILLADGIYEWTNAFYNPVFKKNNITLFNPVLNNYLFCVGKLESNYFKFKGINSVKYVPIRMKPKIKKISKNSSKKFLITTSNTPYYNKYEKNILTEILKKIIKELENKKILYDFRIYDKQLIRELNIPNSKNFLNCSFEECLENAAFVISTPSSVNLIAMYHSKPVGTLIYRDSPIMFSSGWNISNFSDISKSIKSMQSYEKERMDFQSFQVNNYYSENKIDFKQMISLNSNSKTLDEKEQDVYMKLLLSRFNFNFEFYFRRIYSFLKNL